MALTIKSVEKITGCSLYLIKTPDTFFLEACKGGVPVALGQGRDLKAALQSVVDAVYKINSAQAMENSDWRCERCGRGGTGLEAHHKVHRSKGRNDDPKNIWILCAACHRICHS